MTIMHTAARTDLRNAGIVTKDISSYGSYFFSHVQPSVSDRVQLRFDWPSNNLVLPATGKILRVEKLRDKQYSIAVRFETFPWKLTGIREAAFSYYGSLEKIKRHVEENYCLILPLNAAARVACMETSYFSAFFHAKIGVRFRDWLHQVRIERSMDLIANKGHSVTEAAFAVGYSDLLTFGRAFKKIVKMPPMQFKKMACRTRQEVDKEKRSVSQLDGRLE
jgi:AraC-like DNA-binding protein